MNEMKPPKCVIHNISRLAVDTCVVDIVQNSIQRQKTLFILFIRNLENWLKQNASDGALSSGGLSELERTTVEYSWRKWCFHTRLASLYLACSEEMWFPIALQHCAYRHLPIVKPLNRPCAVKKNRYLFLLF